MQRNSFHFPQEEVSQERRHSIIGNVLSKIYQATGEELFPNDLYHYGNMELVVQAFEESLRFTKDGEREYVIAHFFNGEESKGFRISKAHAKNREWSRLHIRTNEYYDL